MLKILNKSFKVNLAKIIILVVNISIILLVSFNSATTNKYVSFINEDNQTSVNISYLGKGDYSVNELQELMELIGASYNENSQFDEIFYQTSSLDIQIPYLTSNSQVKIVSYSDEYVEFLKVSKLIDDSQADILQKSQGAIIPSTLVPYVDDDFFNYIVENSVAQDNEINKNAIKIEGSYLANSQTIMISEEKLYDIAAASGVTPSYDLKVMKPDLKSAIEFEEKFQNFIDSSDYAISVLIEEPLYNDIILVLNELTILLYFIFLVFNVLVLMMYIYMKRLTSYKEDFKIVSNIGVSKSKIFYSLMMNNFLYYFTSFLIAVSVTLLSFRYYCNNFEIPSSSEFSKIKNTTLFDSTSNNSVNLNLEINTWHVIIIFLIGFLMTFTLTNIKYKINIRK